MKRALYILEARGKYGWHQAGRFDRYAEAVGERARLERLGYDARIVPDTRAHGYGAPPPSSRDLSRAKRKRISEKIRILRHEGYPEKQAIAIAYRMAGVPPVSRAPTRKRAARGRKSRDCGCPSERSLSSRRKS